MKWFLVLLAALVVLQLAEARKDRRFVPDRKSYAKAKAHCEAYNMQLMVIRSDEKMREVIKRMNKDNVHDVWLGIRRDDYPANTLNIWKYDSVDNGILAKLYWLPHQPDNYKDGERCVQMRALDTDTTNLNRWNDIHCDTELAFYCEKY